MDRFQATVFDLRVDLSGANAGVSEQLLQGANFSTTRQHVSGETVAQCVRADFLAGANASRIAFHELPDRDTRK